MIHSSHHLLDTQQRRALGVVTQRDGAVTHCGSAVGHFTSLHFTAAVDNQINRRDDAEPKFVSASSAWIQRAICFLPHLCLLFSLLSLCPHCS